MVLSQESLCSVNVAIQTGALPSKVRVVGSNPLPGTVIFFLPFFSSTSFLTPRVYPGVCASVERVLRVYGEGPACLSGGPSYHRLRP